MSADVFSRPIMSLCLVAQRGEQIICPFCKALFVRFADDAYSCDDEEWPMEGPGAPSKYWDCVVCGKSVCSGVGETLEIDAEMGLTSALYIRSGKWEGWRTMGGGE